MEPLRTCAASPLRPLATRICGPALVLWLAACGAEPDQPGPTLVWSESNADAGDLANDGLTASDGGGPTEDGGRAAAGDAADDLGPSAGDDAIAVVDSAVFDATGPDTSGLDSSALDAGAPDAAIPDAGTPDTGTPDTGTPDAGTPDAGTPDAGTPDTGTPDAGTPDAGTPDAGCQPTKEVCDGVDNDCNGTIDEGGAALCADGKPCTVDACAGTGGCTHKPVTTAAACEGGTIVAGRCYRATKKTGKWGDAEAACKAWGGHLASIASSAENDAVRARAKGTCGDDTFWIGLNDLNKEGAYAWSDGSAVSFSKWAKGEPNDFFDEDVVASFSDGNWNDVDQDDQKTCFVCERAAATVCSDGDACTHNDACDTKGVCVGQKISCNDGNACTTDACSQQSGCAHTNLKDGAVCLKDSTCKAGVCTIGTAQQPAVSCLAILQATKSSKSGLYWLDPDGSKPAPKFQAWCDMEFAGGGWTLVMKLDGNKTTFGYTSTHWTSDKTHNPGSADMSLNEAKLASFSSVPFSALRLGMRVAGKTNWVTLSVSGSSLRSALSSGKYKATNLGRNAWKQLIAYSSLQPNCNQEGLNTGNESARVRIGIVGNIEKDCKTPNSRIGFGGDGSSCYQDGKNTCGNTARCGGDLGVRNTKAFGFILVR